MPRAVLLDLDDTLLANRALDLEHITEVSEAVVRELPEADADAIVARFVPTREAFYRHVLSGEWDVERYREAHLRALVAPWGEPSDALIARAGELRRELPARSRLADGAETLLRGLRERGARIGLLTNGPSELQRGKLALVGLADAFDAIGVSEELGAAKPDPAAFAATLDLLGAAAADTVMVGDNLDNDIAGALEAGLAGAVWVRVDPEDPRVPPPGVPTVDHLDAVLGHVYGPGQP